ncbi:hypothetical protein [Xanthomonas axonopodis]
MIKAIEYMPVANRDLVRLNAANNPWKLQLIEVANSVSVGGCILPQGGLVADGKNVLGVGRCILPQTLDATTYDFLHVLSMLDHPSEWIGDHHYEASTYVDQLHTLLLFGADPSARLSNGRDLLDVLTAENRYQLWKAVSENIPKLAILAFECGALASREAAMAMILPVYPTVDPQHIDQETSRIVSMVEHMYLNHVVPQVELAAKAVRL